MSATHLSVRFLCGFLALALAAACQVPAAAPPAASRVVVGTPRPANSASAAPAASPSPVNPSSAVISPLPRVMRLVAIGASDVVGYGSADPPNDGWATVLAKNLPGTTELTKLGFIGRLARDMRKAELPQAVAAKPDVIVLWTGVNDINAGVSVETFAVDLDVLLGGLAGTGARLFVVNLPDLDRLPFFKAQAAVYREVLPAWQDAMRLGAATHGGQVIDLGAYTREIEAHPEYLATDGFHPSTAGYRRLAEIFARAIGETSPGGK